MDSGAAASSVSSSFQEQQQLQQQQRHLTLEECLYGQHGPIVPKMKKTKQHSPKKTSSDSKKDSQTASDGGDAAAAEEEEANDATETTMEDLNSSLAQLAPVSSKWSDCATSSDDDYDSDVISLTAPPPTHVIPLAELRRIVAASGIVDDDGDDEWCGGGEGARSHRAVAWRVLMGYLPDHTATWNQVLQEKRDLYVQLATDLFDDCSDIVERADELRASRRRRGHRPGAAAAGAPPPPQPLNLQHMLAPTVIPASIKHHWKQKSLDLHVLERLTKDLNALRMDEFVASSTENGEEEDVATAEEQTSTATATTTTTDDNVDDGNNHNHNDKNVNNESQLDDFVESALLLDEIRKDVVRTHPDMSFFLDPVRNLGRRRYAALERILFVWSKYNKGVKYVQGMNEIVGIIYYVMANDESEEWSAWAEADTYWLFHILLTDMSDVFVPGLDNLETGITGRINAMHKLLARHDPEVVEHLSELGIEVSFYAIRWWTTLLSREFLLPDTIRLWDSLFASTHRDNFLRYVCVAMIMSIRKQLLKGDFSTCLKLLHSFPTTNVERLLESSRALWIYESQISVACHRGGLSLHQALNTIASPPSLIFAFGFPNGTPPISRTEQLERTKKMAEERARSAARAAQGMFGQARGLFHRHMKDLAPSKMTRSTSADEALTMDRKSSEVAGDDDDDDLEDDVYLAAVLNADDS